MDSTHELVEGTRWLRLAVVGALVMWTGFSLIGAYLVARHPGAKFVAAFGVEDDQPVPSWIINTGVGVAVVGFAWTAGALAMVTRTVDLDHKPDHLQARMARVIGLIALPPLIPTAALVAIAASSAKTRWEPLLYACGLGLGLALLLAGLIRTDSE